MLSVWQCVLIVTGTVVLSLVFLTVLRRIWPATQRTEHNDIIGWQISVLGTTYAVILAFMLWNVWSNFQTARINTEMEANFLVDLYRIAGGLEPAEGKSLRALCREYAAVAVSEEWPAMAEEKLSSHSFSVTQQIGMCWCTRIQMPRPRLRAVLWRIIFSSPSMSRLSTRSAGCLSTGGFAKLKAG